MKKLKELGISPAPWSIEYDDTIDRVVNILDANKNIIVETDYGFYPPKLPDARVMKAAPELYEALLEALPWLADIGAEVVGNEPAKKIAKVVRKAEAALAKASGESEVAK